MRKTKSPILEAVHETAKGLHAVGLMDHVTMREFDRLCLPPIEPLSPRKTRKIREQSRVSQAVFAAHLNTSVRDEPELFSLAKGAKADDVRNDARGIDHAENTRSSPRGKMAECVVF